MPVALNGERVGAEAEAALMLPRIDFDLQLQRLPAARFGGKPEHQMNRMLGLRSAAFAQPRQGVPDPVDDVADGLRTRLHQIDVLGVSQRPLEEQFVDRRAAAEGDPVAKGRAREQVAQCARDNQVLLHLPKIGPGGRGGPLLDEGLGNHSSISTAVFTMSFQSGIRSFAIPFCGSSCLTDGSIAVNDLALTAKGRRALAWRSCPKRSSK